MYKMMEQTKAKELLAIKTDSSCRVVNKDQLFQLQKLSERYKYSVEISNCYVGYKLFWIMHMFLEGRKFPDGCLTND